MRFLFLPIHRFIILLITIQSIALFSDNSFARLNTEERALAKFFYGLVDHIEWSKTQDITVCVYGYDMISSYFGKISISSFSKVKSVNFRNVELDEFSGCNALYVAKNKEKYLSQVVNHALRYKTITISNIDNFVGKGGMIEFKIERQRARLDVNKDKLAMSDLSLSPLLSPYIE